MGKTCPKCQASMAEGFTLDVTHGYYGTGHWIEGAPQKSFWTGVKLNGKKKLPIETWRCPRCGFLENYAAPPR